MVAQDRGPCGWVVIEEYAIEGDVCACMRVCISIIPSKRRD